MKKPKLICTDERRRDQVRAQAENWNGLDFVEVEDRVDKKSGQPATWLAVHFINRAPVSVLPENVIIEGGRRVQGIQVREVRLEPAPDKTRDDIMWVRVEPRGDSSVCALHLVAVDDQKQVIEEADPLGVRRYRPFPGFDPPYASVPFRFQAEEISLLDCKPALVCPPEPLTEPALDYLAKDYTSFRQLIYDRLALIMPDWRERHVPDIGVALVELLAYVGDYLSQYQDAVATEAYLHTARLRTSVRRHARLVDYRLHEGCNARVWVQLRTNMDLHETLQPGELQFGTGLGIRLPDAQLVATKSARTEQGEAFEPLLSPGEETIHLYRAHNEIRFYTWGDDRCCLPRGATSTTLIDDCRHYDPSANLATNLLEEDDELLGEHSRYDRRRVLNLRPGDLLLLEEIIGPETGDAADADPARRHVVRLNRADRAVDALYQLAVLEVGWAREDALPFPLCISTLNTPENGCRKLENVSVARGNLFLADHGRTLDVEDLGTVPMIQTEQTCVGEEDLSDITRLPGIFAPVLRQRPIAYAQPLRPVRATAAMLEQDPRAALPCVEVWSIQPRPDGSGPLFTASDLNDPSELIEALLMHDHARAGHLYAYLSRRTLWLLHKFDEAKLAQGQRAQLQAIMHAEIRQMRPRRGPPAETPLPALQKMSLRESLRIDLRRLLRKWEPRLDLIDSRPADRHFMVEVDNEGHAQLRFGDGQLGRQPEAGEAFVARYRVGGGPAGNVGAGAISDATLDPPIFGLTLAPRNPFPAWGGVAPETLAEARQNAAHALHTRLERAITPEDYAAIVMRDFKDEVQKAGAKIKPDGHRRKVTIAVDPWHRREASQDLCNRIRDHLARFRRAGHTVEVKAADYVPLCLEFTVQVRPGYLKRGIQAELLDLFSNHTLPDGRKGFFHPDNFSFGDDVCESRLVAAAQVVPGVESIQVTSLAKSLFRVDSGPVNELDKGRIPIKLREQFTRHGCGLSKGARVKVKQQGSRWTIADGDTSPGNKKYAIRKEYEILGVYFLANNVLEIGALEIARLDNDPEFPENGILSFEMAGGR